MKSPRWLLVLAVTCHLGGFQAAAGVVCAAQAEGGHSCCSRSDAGASVSAPEHCGCRMTPASVLPERELLGVAADNRGSVTPSLDASGPFAAATPTFAPIDSSSAPPARDTRRAGAFLSGAGFRC